MTPERAEHGVAVGQQLNLSRDLQSIEIEGRTVAVYVNENGRAEFYEIVGTSRNPRTFVAHDGLCLDGDFLEPDYDGLVACYHPMMGRHKTFVPHEWLDEPAILLDRLSADEGAVA